MNTYRLTIQLSSGGAEVEEVRAESATEAAFLLGAVFGMTSALSKSMYSAYAQILGVGEVAEVFMEATHGEVASVKVEVL